MQRLRFSSVRKAGEGGAKRRAHPAQRPQRLKEFSASDAPLVKCGLLATPAKKYIFKLKKDASGKSFSFAFSIFA